MTETTQFILAVGNAFDGMTIYGPYDNAEQANEAGDKIRNEEWVVAPLHKPWEDDEDEENDDDESVG